MVKNFRLLIWENRILNQNLIRFENIELIKEKIIKANRFREASDADDFPFSSQLIISAFGIFLARM